MKKKKLAATSFIILSSLVTLVSTTSVSLTQPKNIDKTNQQTKEKYVYEDMPAYKINNVVLYGANQITVVKNKYINLLDAIWDQGKILAYDPAWGFVSSHIQIETPDINLTSANEKTVIISVVGSNGKKVSKNITLNVVDALSNSDPHNLKGTFSPYVFTQNLAMYKQFNQSNFVDQDWQPIVRQSLQTGDIVKIRQTNPKFVKAVGNQTFKFWLVPGVYQRTAGPGNLFIFKNANELTNDWVNFTIPGVSEDSAKDKIKKKDIKNFGILLNTSNFINLPQEDWPTFEYQIEPKVKNETLKNSPWLVFQNIENIKDKTRFQKVIDWNIRKEAEFKKYWNENSDLTNAIISDNTFLLQLSGYARDQLKNVDIWKKSRGNQLVYDQYSRFVGMNFDDVNNPNNDWTNTPVAARSYLILSGHDVAGGGAVSGVATYADGYNILDMLGDSVLIRHEWGHLHQGRDKFSKNSELTETTNMVMGTLVNLSKTDWTKLSNSDLIWNYKKAKGDSDSWPVLLKKLNTLQAQLGPRTYRSIDAYNALRSVPIFQMFRQTSPDLWIQASRLIREYYGLATADPRKTNPELASANDTKINEIRAQRLETWSKKYPPLANNPDFWDFLTYLAIKNYNKDFTNVLAKIGIVISEAVKKYAIEQKAEEVFEIQDILSQNLNADFFKKAANVTSIYDFSTEKQLKELGLPFTTGNLSFEVSAADGAWLKNKKIYLYKRGSLIKVFDYTSANQKFEIKGLDSGVYSLVFPQENSGETKYSLEPQTFYVKNNIDNNFIYHYNTTENNLKNTTRIRLLGSNNVLGVEISYDPTLKSIIFDSKTNRPHHRQGGYYGFILRDKTTPLYSGETKEIDSSTNYYKFIYAQAPSGVNNVFIDNVKLNEKKLKEGKYELWLFHVEGLSQLTTYNQISGNQLRFFVDGVTTQKGSNITSNIIGSDTYYFFRVKINEKNGFEFLKNNKMFNFDKAKTANYVADSDTIDTRFDSFYMDSVANKLTELTSEFKQKNPDLTQTDLNVLRNTLDSLLYYKSYLSSKYKTDHAEKFKKVDDLITKLQNFQIIYIEKNKPFEVLVDKPFSPYEFIKIISSKDGLLSADNATVVQTNIRVNKNGEYYVSALGTYDFKFKVTSGTLSKEFTIQINAVKTLTDTKKSISKSVEAVSEIDQSKDPNKIKLADYDKNILYGNLNKNRTIVGSDYYISVFNNTIQKIDFSGNVIAQINVSSRSINNVEKIVVDNHSEFVYALVSNNIDGNIFLTKVLKIKLYDFTIEQTFLTPDGVDNIGYFNNKILVWKTGDDTSYLKNNSGIYEINLTTNQLSPFKITDGYFDSKNYITNIFHIDSYSYESFDRNEDGTPKSVDYKTFSFDDAYVVFMVNSEGKQYYIVVDSNFNNVTHPKYISLPSWLTNEGPLKVENFIMEPQSDILSGFSYVGAFVGTNPSSIAKYASQNIKQFGNNKFSYSGFPNYINDNSSEANANEMIVDINKQNGGLYFNPTKKDLDGIIAPKDVLVWSGRNSLASSAYGQSGSLRKNNSIGDSLTLDGNTIISLPISQGINDYKNYNNSLDASNWYVLVDEIKNNSDNNLKSTLALNYKSLIGNDLSLNNLTGRLTRIDATHLILSFFNSETKFGLTFNKEAKTFTATKLNSASSTINYKFASYNMLSGASPEDKAKITAEIKKIIPKFDSIQWYINDEEGFVEPVVSYKQKSWITGKEETIVQTFQFNGFLSQKHSINYLPNDSYQLEILKSDLPSKVTKEELIKNKIIVLQNNVPKDAFNIQLVPNDNEGTLQIITTSTAVSKITKSITYSGFMKPNKDFYWIPPKNGQKIPEVGNNVSKEEVQKLFKVNDGTLLKDLNYSVKGNLLNVKLNLTRDEKPKIYSTSFLIDPSKPAVEPEKPTPVVPKKPETQPTTSGTTPIQPKKPADQPITPKKPETQPATPGTTPIQPKKPDTSVDKPTPEKPVQKPVSPVDTPTKPVSPPVVPPKEHKTKPVEPPKPAPVTPIISPPVVTPVTPVSVVPVIPIIPVDKPTPEKPKVVTPSLSSINIKSLSAKIVDNSLEIKVDFDHISKSDNDKLVTIKIIEKDNNKVFDKIVPLNKSSISFSFDNLDKSKKYAISSIELEKSPMKLLDSQKVLPEFKNKQSSTIITDKTPNANPKDNNKSSLIWIIGPIAGGIALITSLLFFLFKWKKKKSK